MDKRSKAWKTKRKWITYFGDWNRTEIVFVFTASIQFIGKLKKTLVISLVIYLTVFNACSGEIHEDFDYFQSKTFYWYYCHCFVWFPLSFRNFAYFTKNERSLFFIAIPICTPQLHQKPNYDQVSATIDSYINLHTSNRTSSCTKFHYSYSANYIVRSFSL